MREITTHKTGLLNQMLRVEAQESGKAGAPYRYTMYLKMGREWSKALELRFQDGPLREIVNDQEVEHLPNGVSNESLLAVVLDRLQGFQHGQFKCDENAEALVHVREALFWLQARSQGRIERGVEGRQVP